MSKSDLTPGAMPILFDSLQIPTGNLAIEVMMATRRIMAFF
jgi:hypothetical protein